MMNRVLGLAIAIGLTLAVPVKTRADDDEKTFVGCVHSQGSVVRLVEK